MNKLLMIFLCSLLLPATIFAQKSKKKPYSTIHVSTTLNFYPNLEPYTFFNTFSSTDDDLILNFLTSNSGTFVIEEEQTLIIDRTRVNVFPTQLFSVGASVQISNDNSFFHEISLTRLSLVKSEFLTNFTFDDAMSNPVTVSNGYKQNASAFGFRYEYGKFFGDPKYASVRFGISGAIEPSVYFYRRTPFSSREFPIKASIYRAYISLIPMLSFKMSDKISVDLKIIPNMLVADHENVKDENPVLLERNQIGTRTYNLPEIDMAFSLLVKYIIKEPKRRQRG